MNDGQREAQRALRSLRRSVRNALLRKRQLGQHAVVWREGRCVRVRAAELVADATRARGGTT